MVEHDEAASGEAVLRECVGRSVSILVLQFPHNALVGNPNRSFSEFNSCLPGLPAAVNPIPIVSTIDVP